MDFTLLFLGGMGGFLYAFGNKILNFLPILSYLVCRTRFYHITQQDKAVIVSRKVRDWSSELRDGHDASGFFCGWPYLGWLQNSERFVGNIDRQIYIFTTQGTYDSLTADPNPPPSEGDIKKITILENTSMYYAPSYKPRVITIVKVPNMEQQRCIDMVMHTYDTIGNKRNVTVFLHGGVGTGKSMTTLFIANAMQAQHTKDLKPSSPGMSLKTIYAAANPSPHEPLVLVLEEVDILLKRISEVELPAHKLLQATVTDKTGWNSMLDDIDNGLYPFMITILTSNKTPDDINAMDPAYIRPGRVHAYFEMKRPCVEEEEEEENETTETIIDISSSQ
jgi:hypothetical protein